jgi:hypothetical protein
MAEYLLRNSLNPNKVVKCTITFRQIVNKGENGEPVWLMEIGTVEPHKDGGKIPPIFVHYITSINLDETIKEATEKIAEQINWEFLIPDLRPPFVIYSFPEADRINSVGIYTSVIVDIQDILPAAGIDPDSIEVIVNDIDVSDEISLDGDPYQYRIRWDPKVRVYDYY